MEGSGAGTNPRRGWEELMDKTQLREEITKQCELKLQVQIQS